MIPVFVSYCRKNSRDLERVLNSLSPLHARGLVEVWYDNDLQPGVPFHKTIYEQLSKADVVVAVITADFIASEYAFLRSDSEYRTALQRHREGKALLVPVIARPSAWATEPDISFLEVLPKGGDPAGKSDKKWAEIAAALANIFESRLSERQRVADLGEYYRWLSSEHQFLEVRGLRNAPDFAARKRSITDLYLPLRVRGGDTHSRDRNILDVVREGRCTVILGGAGQGKTTTLRYVTWSYAKDRNRPVPITFTARRLARHLDEIARDTSPSPKALLDFWATLNEEGQWHLSVSWMEQKLHTGDVIFLVDALDEVPKGHGRSQVLELIRAAVIRWPKSRWCLTSRPHAWQDHATLPFEPAVLCELNDAEIERFLGQWSDQMGREIGDPTVPHQFRSELTQAIMENRHMRLVARTPLSLTAMCVIFWNRRKRPTARLDLYRAIGNWLLEARAPSDPALSVARRLSLYSQLAFEMFLTSHRTEGDFGQLRQTLASALQSTGVPDASNLASRFLEFEEAETGLLHTRGGGIIAFNLPPFQEFLAARYLFSLPDSEWTRFVQANCLHDHFRGVLTFLAATLVSEGLLRTPLFVDAVLQAIPTQSLEQKAFAVGLLGELFRDVGPQEYDLRQIPRFAALDREVQQIFDPSLASRLPLADRHVAALSLGRNNDIRLRGGTSTFVEVPAGRVVAGAQSTKPSGDNYDPLAEDEEGPVHEIFSGSFEIGIYPVTVQEFRHFVESEGYRLAGRRFWSDEGWSWREETRVVQPDLWEEQLHCPNCPVTHVNWFEAEAYCRWLTDYSPEEWQYRLPTEAEWEFAVRRGDSSYRAYTWSGAQEPLDQTNSLDGYSRLCPVGLFVSDRNQLGIRDLNGNVSEWTQDEYGRLSKDPVLAPVARFDRRAGEFRHIIRGGNFANVAVCNRTSTRAGVGKYARFDTVGFRVVRRRKPIAIKKRVPTPSVPYTLADLYARYAFNPLGRRSLNQSLDAMSRGLAKRTSKLLEELFPKAFRRKFNQRLALPCRMGDNRHKFEFNLLYQDTRIKLAVHDFLRRTDQATDLERARRQTDILLGTVSLILASPWEAGGQLWEHLNDNDLDAIVFCVLEHFDPQRRDDLLRAGREANKRALKALPDLETLKQSWDLKKLLRYQIFAGTHLLDNESETLDGQFAQLGEFHYFDLEHFQRELSRPDAQLLFLFDDNGELVWDLALIQYLVETHPNLQVVGITSSQIVANNSNSETVNQCLDHPKLQRLSDSRRFRLLHEDNLRSSLDLACCSPACLREFESATFILVKGVAAFETLQRLPRPAFYAFVVHSRDSQICTGLPKETGVFVAMPAGSLGYVYGQETLLSRRQSQA